MKKINVGEALGILSNIGVIAGIVFLAFELQQNNDSLNAQSRHNHAMARAGSFDNMSSNEVLAPLLVKARSGEELDSVEETRLYYLYLHLFTKFEWEWGEHELGRIDLPINGWRKLFMELPNHPGTYPGFRDAWETNKEIFSPEFASFMDQYVVNWTGD